MIMNRIAGGIGVVVIGLTGFGLNMAPVADAAPKYHASGSASHHGTRNPICKAIPSLAYLCPQS